MQNQIEPLSPLVQWAPVASAIITLLAVLVALFQATLFLWLRQPSLQILLRLEPPDCTKTQIRLTAGIVHAYYLRLWVKNTGRTTATRVQVFAADLQRKHTDGIFRKEQRFLPMNLLWTHTGVAFVDGIAPQMGQHCELGGMFPPNLSEPRLIRPANLPAGKTHLQLETEVKPFTGASSLEPGIYRLRVLVAASNAKPREFTIELSVVGDWYEDEAEMFKKGLGARVL